MSERLQDVDATVSFKACRANSDSVLYLQAYSLTAAYPYKGHCAVIAYNSKGHSLDIFGDFGGYGAIRLDSHGPNGIPDRLCALYAVSADSIWVLNRVGFYSTTTVWQWNAAIRFSTTLSP